MNRTRITGLASRRSTTELLGQISGLTRQVPLVTERALICAKTSSYISRSLQGYGNSDFLGVVPVLSAAHYRLELSSLCLLGVRDSLAVDADTAPTGLLGEVSPEIPGLHFAPGTRVQSRRLLRHLISYTRYSASSLRI